MKTRLLFIGIGFFFLFFFYLFSWQVRKDRFHQLNFDTTVKLQDRMPKRFDGRWEDVTFFVEPGMSIIIVGGLTVAALIEPKKKKIRLSAFIIPLLFGLLVFAEVYGKSKVESPAPPFFMLKNPTTILPKYYVQEKFSYPSGHAARALYFAATAFFILRRYTKKLEQLLVWAGLLSLFVITISIGKIYLGHHWLSDIIGGYLIAAAFGSFVGAVIW